MKILKLLNKTLSILLLVFFISFNSIADEKPVDIWNIEQNKIEKDNSSKTSDNIKTNSDHSIQTNIYNLQSQKEIETVKVESSVDSQEVKIIGLYDPEDYDLKIDLWSNSNGDQLKYLFSNLFKLDLSEDASELMNIALLTNSYYPEKNITETEFLKIKSDWLIKNNNRELIEEYLIKNRILNLHPELTRYLIDQYLSESNVEKSCKIFLKNTEVINDE